MPLAALKLARFVFLGLALTLAIPALAAADAPDVVSATGSVVSVDANGNRTVEVHGLWAWTTHGSDCNLNRAGIGIAIDWGDSNGNFVTNLPPAINVGVKTATLLNAADNIAHPAEPTSLAAANATTTAAWRSGCGTYATHPTGVGDPFQAVGKYPAGSFGTVLGGGPDAGAHYLTHVYPPGPIPAICALTYDVHGKTSNTAPNGIKEITAGGSNHNTDNSAEKNAQTPAGNVCANVSLLSTTPTAPTVVAPGGTSSDSALLEGLNGTANGKVDFKLYGPDPTACVDSGPGQTLVFDSGDQSITGPNGSGNYTATSGNSGALTTKGTYYWVASYHGDTHGNSDATGTCLDATERIVVGLAVTTDTAATTNPLDPLVVGDGRSFADTATLQGADSTADGKITFKLFSDSTCSTAVTAFGDPLTPGSEDVAIADVDPGAGFDFEATSSSFQPTDAGHYYWRASYTHGTAADKNGDVALTTCGDGGEDIVVDPATPTVATTASANTTLGKSISDSAAISGLVNASPFGTISFDVYGPNDTDCDGIDDTDGVTAVPFTHVGDVAVTGNGAYSSDDTANGGSVFTPAKAGTYVWVANYSGDANNSVTANPCDDTANGSVEHVVVTKPPPPPPPPPDNPGPPARHPGIQIDKTGPATAVAGANVPYLLAVTNTGDQSFLEAKVVLGDPVCGATPTLVNPGGKNGDVTPASLDPGETWYYTCSVQTALGQTNVHNVGTVTGTDEKGDVVSDDDPADTVLSQPAQAVLPLLPGSARLRGPSGCLAGGPHKLVVTGRRIATVTFFLDGKKVATKRKADSHGRFTYTVNRKHLRSGIHKIVARVTYLHDTTGGQKTFNRTFAKCAKALKPEFTG